MEGSAVNAIAELTRQGTGIHAVVTVDGRELSTVALHNPPKAEKPDEPATMVLHSLDGLVDYIAANRDLLKAEECIVHVAGPSTVVLRSKLQDRGVRFAYVKAEATNLWAGMEATKHTLEEANIALQARVVDVGDRAAVLQILGNVKADGELLTQDDGFTQTVKTRAGITLADRAGVPNPVELAPYRTFREIDQPPSPFVLRLHGSSDVQPTVSFHLADGGEWELEAVEEIAGYLKAEVGDFAVIR